MRLLQFNNNSGLSLTKDFASDEIPEYAILSHTWGADTDEVTFQDLTNGTGEEKSGHKKIWFCGEQASRDGLEYFWVDTCCINKQNNTELSEAINSMFRWYQNATKCYVYLSDVSTSDHDQADPSVQSWQPAFRKSRWFTRGWTLQELIAPLSVEFFSSNNERLGDKKSLERQLHERTGIAVLALQGTSLSEFRVEDIMSWAENRHTKREEDKAYSLFGIFDISMLPIYGEGVEKAFERLKEELFKRSRKHHLDELSVVSHTFSSAKRFKNLRSQPSSVSSGRNPNFLDPRTLVYSKYAVDGDSPIETRREVDAGGRNSIDATTKQSLIDQLYFNKIDERLTSLTAAQGTTCRWFLDKSEYKAWHNVEQQPNHGGFLWIKGNPGTGKSTLMKLLFERAKVNANNDLLQITLSFFFLARGTAEEKSTTGLYRSLLHQLFEKASDLRDSLEWMTSDGARGIQRNGWDGEALKQTFTHAVQKLGSRSLTIFVDALDECDKNQAAGMVCFFEELCDRAREAHVRLKICFSSRHYPTIVVQKGIEVTLEDEIGHTKDIEQYIKSKLRLGKSKLKQAELLRSEILEKSSSIFLWAVLVLDIINSEYPDSAISIKSIRERLKQIPPKLTDLFEMILTRDGENLERLQVCLKWILFAIRPLKPQELYFAVQLGVDKQCSGFWDREDVDLEQIKTFVRSSSKGLAEVTRNKASEVQFIHESVRDFLVGKYESQWSGSSSNFEGYGHELLRNCCLAQLYPSIDKDADIPDPLPQASKAAQLRETIGLKFPFLEYSVLYVLHHANVAQQNAMEQATFFPTFPLRRWILLNNTLEKFDVRRYTESVSLLYILAEKNLTDLIRIHPQRESCFNIEKERYGPPIFAALATGSYKAVLAFLEVQANIQPQEPILHHLCNQYSENINKCPNFGRNFTFSRHRNITSYVAELGDELILSFLYTLGKLDVKSKDKFDRTPLLCAAEQGHEAVVKLLLEKGAKIEAQYEFDGRTSLICAAEQGHEAVVKLLLEKGANTEAKYEFKGWTPLLWAAEKGHEAVVKLLLEEGAEIEAKDQRGRTSLLWAAEKEHETVVKLLLEKGANTEAKDEFNGWTPLFWAALSYLEGVAKLLLENGAKLEAQDNSGRTPLSWAASTTFPDVRTVELLLEKGAKVEAKDEGGRTPLSWAVSTRIPFKGSGRVVELLLENGAKLEAKDNNGRTPLFWAVESLDYGAVKMLLEKGAKVDAKDESGETPLFSVVKRGNKANLRLLPENGADVEVNDRNGETPLSLAKYGWSSDIAELLLENGAKL